MGKKASRRELEKSLDSSRRALPFGIAIALFGCGAIWGVRQWLHAPRWAVVLPAFGPLVGYIVNVVYCRWALRRLGSSET